MKKKTPKTPKGYDPKRLKLPKKPRKVPSAPVPARLPPHMAEAGLAIDFTKPLESQAERLAVVVTRDLPEDFALLPEGDYVTNPDARPEALQPGFVALPSPIIDRMDDGSSYEFHGAAIIDGQLVFQGQRRERAATSRVLGMAKGRSFTAMLQAEQERAGAPSASPPAPVEGAPDVPPPTGGTSMATLEKAGLAKAGTPLEGRCFRLPATTDAGGVARVRAVAEYVILASLGLHASDRMVNFFERSTIDYNDKTGKSVERADKRAEGLYPGGGAPGGLY